MPVQITNAQNILKREVLGHKFVFGCFIVLTEQGAFFPAREPILEPKHFSFPDN